MGYRIHSDNATKGWAQWLAVKEDRLVGATLVGTDAAELIHASTVAIVGGLKWLRLQLITWYSLVGAVVLTEGVLL